MSQQILLTLNDTAGNALGQYNINTAGSALHIQAVDGAYYQFTDPMTGIGPEGIITEREGDNLLVSFDEGTDLVIENYFAQNEPGALVGMQADGGLFSYPVATAPEHVLAEELAASQTLGSEQPVWAPLGVLGAVGLVAAGIGLAKDDSGKGWDSGNNGGSGSGNNPSPNTPAPNPSPNNPSNPSNPGGPNIPSPNPGNPGNPSTPTPTPNPSPYPPAPSPNPVPQPPTPNQPGSDPKPIANHDKVKGTPKEKVTIDVLDNDSGMDANGQRDLNPSSIRLLDAAGKPVTELTVAGQGKWNVSFGKVTFTPETNFIGNPTPVQYTVSDNAGQVSNKATITVTYDNGTPGGNTKGRAVITGDAKVGQTLSADINDPDGVPATGVKYQWMADGVAIQGATGPTYTVSAADKDKAISLNISYTDNRGNPENISTPSTSKVVDGTPTPQPPQPGQNHPGSVAISGNAKVGEKLTADVHDDDQFDEAKVSYQWQRDGKPITGANGKTYTLTADDEGHKISVKAEYTDNAGNKESHNSAVTTNVAPSTSTNHAPTDITLANNSVIEGKDGATIGKLTTTDPDAGDQHTYTVNDNRFEVTADGTLKLKAGQHLDYTSEKTVTLQITSDDGHGGTVSKTLTLNVQDDPNYPTPNPQPPTPPGTNHEGTVSITGEAKVGETLTATVNDDDGVPANVTYQWLANGVAIAGATGSSYQLTAAEAGKTISVRATYTDNAQHSEAPISSATAPVVDPANPNPQPPVPPTNHEGTVTITGEAKVGETLTATVNDDDGVPANVTYQWLANGVAIAGATGSSYQLTANDAGKTISVRATYTDNANHSEAPTSTATVPVVDPTNPNPQPPQPQPNHEGTVSITGEAKVGETLTAEVQDQDGVPDTGVTYQWLRDGKEIAGATGKSYTLTADDVGQKISVKAAYQDNAQHAEAPTSAETEAVTQIDNNQPGSVTIVHPQDIETGAVLRAVIDDSDGVPTAGVLYQWLRDGKPINHANPVARYELRSEDEGHDISVHVEYTDKNGHKESLTSEPLNFPEDKGPDFTLERGTGTEQGGVTLIPTEKATIADLNYEKNGLSQNVHIVRADANSPWHSDDPLPQGVTLDAKTGVLKVAPQEVDDGSQVYASVYEGRSSKTLYLITENDVGNPPLPQSEAEVSFYTTDSIIEGNAQSYVVRLSKPAETDVTVELKISHVSTNESQIHAETRTITIPKGQISKTVFVETEDDKQFSADARFQAELQNPQGAKLADQDTSAITRIIDNDGPQAPVLKAGSEVGGVEILPQEGAKILHVYYQSEADGSTQDFVATRNNDGRWTAREPHDRVTLDAQTGKVTLGALAVQDRSEVRAFNESELHVRSEESKIFAGDNPASPPPAVNQQGTVTISGDTKVGSTLTAEVTDGDGVPSDGVKYQWLRDNTPISGATGKSYVLTTDDAGHKITVKAEYDDNAKHHETPVSQPTENIADNAPPAVNQQGTVTISGDPKVGSTLTAEVTDGDGVPSDGVKYQWLRDGNPIASATGKSYVLTAEDAGHKITVKAEYDDNAQNHETPVSQPTENIADNSAPPPAANHPGSVTLEGEAKIGHTLTAKLTDADGVPDSGITWRWYGDDKLLPGVEGQTITLTDAVKGMQLRAEAVYTDKAGHAEKPISDLSPAVVPEAANNSDLFPPPAANAPHITLSGVTSVKEGEKATYTVSLDKPASEDVSVDVHVKHNSTDTSDANLTYKIQRVVIPKGETSKNFTVDTHNDGKAEGTETYTVEIGNALVGNVNDNVPPFSGSVSAQSMIIPAYKYPTGAWQPDTYWESVHKAGGGKVPYVIVNPASGVGEKVKSDYAKLIDDNITAGIKNIGYIRTHYQTRPIEEVKAEVDKYLELYGKDKIHGYFFDEITAQNNQGTAYMAELYRYVKAKAGDKLVMANPGTHITDAIAPYADIFVTSEVSAKTYLNNYEQPKSAFENDPKNAHRIMHMIHDVTPDQYDAVIKASRERNAGWVFPTSDTQENPLPEAEREKHPEQDGNPYNALPQNFDQLAANVNNLGMPTNPTQHDNNGKLATANIDNNHVTTEIVDANNAAPLEHHEPQLQPADGAVASAADGLEAAAADHTRGGDGHDVLIGDGIDAAAYSQLVSHQGEDLLQYLGQHSAELLAASQQSASHELHGGAGDDVLIAGHGAQLLEGGAGADTFAYLLDSNDAASWNEPSRILDFNPQEGDRIVLAGGDHVKAEVSHDASGQHLHVTDDAGHSRTIDIGAQNGKTLTAEDILSHVEIRTPQGYSEPASSVPQTHHLPQDDHSHLI